MDNDPFESPKLLLARAKENAADFKARVQAYVDSNPHRVIEDIDANTGDKLLKIKLSKHLPGDVRPVFSDAVNNLRHSLDHAVNSAAIQIRGGKRDCYFPFGRDIADFGLIFEAKRYKTIPVALRPYLGSLKPHAGGDDLLCALSRISAPNKHQVVLNVEPTVTAMQNASGMITGNVGLGIGAWDRTKNEVQIARIGTGGQLRMDFQVAYAVTLGGGNAVSGQPALGVLDHFIRITESIILGLEAETARILRERVP